MVQFRFFQNEISKLEAYTLVLLTKFLSTLIFDLFFFSSNFIRKVTFGYNKMSKKLI